MDVMEIKKIMQAWRQKDFFIQIHLNNHAFARYMPRKKTRGTVIITIIHFYPLNPFNFKGIKKIFIGKCESGHTTGFCYNHG